MQMNVRRGTGSLGSEYEIETPGCLYFAKQKFFSLKKRITLTGPRERPVAQIAGTTAFFHSHFDFDLADGKSYEFWTESTWKGVYCCGNKLESYRLYRHKGLDYSIFQSDVQIAAFTKNKIEIGNSDQYEVLLNDDANPVLIICMALTIDVLESPTSGPGVTYDAGNIGPEERPFDRSWLPS